MTALRNNAHQPHLEHDLRKGSALSLNNGRGGWITCNVTAVYPESYTCDVYTNEGGYITSVPWPGAPREISPPEEGAQYLVSDTLPPRLMPAGPSVPLPHMPIQNASQLPGVASNTRTPNAVPQPNFGGSSPRDVLAGDWLRTSSDGNYVGVLKGGVSTLHSGEFAQVQTISNKETGQNAVKIIGNVLSMFSGAGSLQFVTNDNKTSMVFNIGADTETESSPEQENFRVRVEAGQDGDMVRMRVTDSKGRTAYAMQSGPSGDVQSKAKSAVLRVEEGYKLLSNSFLLKAAGNAGIDVGGNFNVLARGSTKIQSYGRLNLSAMGGNASLHSSRGLSLQAANSTTIRTSGPPFSLLPFLSESLSVIATNGSVNFDIGNPIAGDLQTAASGFHVNVKTPLGSIRHSPGAAAGFIVDTIAPLSVKIGGPPIAPHPSPLDPGLFTAVLAEPLLALIVQLALIFDAHVHTSTEVGVLTSPTVTPVQGAAVTAAAAAIPSKIVRFGG